MLHLAEKKGGGCWSYWWPQWGQSDQNWMTFPQSKKSTGVWGSQIPQHAQKQKNEFARRSLYFLSRCCSALLNVKCVCISPTNSKIKFIVMAWEWGVCCWIDKHLKKKENSVWRPRDKPRGLSCCRFISVSVPARYRVMIYLYRILFFSSASSFLDETVVSNSCDLFPKKRELFPALEPSIIWQRRSLSTGWTNGFGGRVGSLVSLKLRRWCLSSFTPSALILKHKATKSF